MEVNISCLSFNIWDLPIWLPKLSRNKRLAKMPQQINALSPDIICLQESFRIASRQRLLSALSHLYHYAGTLKSRWMLPFLRADRTGGLAVISRFSFEDYKFVEHARHARMRFDERLGRKGFTLSLIRTAVGLMFIVNAHLYAGRTQIETDIRLQQLDHLFSYLHKYCPAEAPIILAGDFNASPTTRFPLNTQYDPTPEYQRIMAEGFVDTLPHYGQENITFTGRANIYAKIIIDASEIPKKLDYVFYRPGNKSIEAVEASVVFNSGDFLSDHNGVFCRLKISG
jgi:endonuclease/exonuclease/phosphatase family metal-dependent hydrolase